MLVKAKSGPPKAVSSGLELNGAFQHIPFWSGLVHFLMKAVPSLTNSNGTSVIFSKPSAAMVKSVYEEEVGYEYNAGAGSML